MWATEELQGKPPGVSELCSGMVQTLIWWYSSRGSNSKAHGLSLLKSLHACLILLLLISRSGSITCCVTGQVKNLCGSNSSSFSANLYLSSNFLYSMYCCMFSLSYDCPLVTMTGSTMISPVRGHNKWSGTFKLIQSFFYFPLLSMTEAF